MAREVQQQLSLADDPGLQGDLFGEEPAPSVGPELPGDGGLDDQTLLADASARPRALQRPAAPKPADLERDRDPPEAAQGEPRARC